MSEKPKILLTGAAGRIGRYLSEHLPKRFDLFLTDIREPEETFGHPFQVADIADLDAMRFLCQGKDMVIHFAADPSPAAPWESLLPKNVIGAYNGFQAAQEAGCQRIVFASSINAILGYPKEVQVKTDMPIYPPNLYGATKAWGEAVARFYAHQHDISCLCLRFGGVFNPDQVKLTADHPNLDYMITLADLTKLVIDCLDAPPDLKFGIYHGLSNNRWKHFDISNARQDLGYDPQDDAFQIAGY
ncbi:MAG: NAD(P)-dependent oxidoreductase [Chloroflexota bacterium]